MYIGQLWLTLLQVEWPESCYYWAVAVVEAERGWGFVVGRAPPLLHHGSASKSLGTAKDELVLLLVTVGGPLEFLGVTGNKTGVMAPDPRVSCCQISLSLSLTDDSRAVMGPDVLDGRPRRLAGKGIVDYSENN